MENEESVKKLDPEQNVLIRFIYPLWIVFDWFAQRPQVNVVLWFLLSMVFYGLGVYGDYFILSKNPFITDVERSIFQDAVLLPVLAYLINLNINIQSFVFLCLFILLLAYFAFAYLPRNDFGDYGSSLSLMVLALHPMMAFQFNFIGLVDGISILFSGLLMFIHSPLGLASMALIGVLNHPQMLIISVLIGILRLSRGDKKFRLVHVISIIGGVIIGFIVVRLYLEYFGLDIPVSRLMMMLKPDIQFWLGMRLIELPLSVFTLYGGMIIILLICIFYGYKYKPSFYLTFILIQFISITLALFTLDSTRVFGLISLPSVILCILYTLEFAKRQNEDYSHLVMIFIIIIFTTFFVPKYYALGGNIFLYRSSELFRNMLGQ